jgi:hypothetical protein
VIIGLRLDEGGNVDVVDNAAWLKRRQRLMELGGPEMAVPR